MDDWNKLKKEYYRKDAIVTYEHGYVDFSPDGMKNVKNGEHLAYTAYLNAQKNAADKIRRYFAISYWGHCFCYYMGQIDGIDKTKGKIVFKRLFVDGLYMDGTSFFGKEDHVWMDMLPFADFEIGDCVKFDAEIYRYLKTGNGILIDYGLQNPVSITKIPAYEVPTDEELVEQQIKQLVCETCRYYDQCSLQFCIANPNEREQRIETLKSLEPGKFTALTVLLAYELEYHMMLQTGGFVLDKNDEKYDVMLRLIEICESHPVIYTGDVNEAISKMLFSEKPRIYIDD